MEIKLNVKLLEMYNYDNFRSGRSKPMIVAVIIQVISGSLCAFVPWLWAFLLLRFVVATATGGTMVTSFVLVMELIGVLIKLISINVLTHAMLFFY